ncbi:hypothetical protein MTO96_018195 [Rhipicephalus appendiculatus]
MIMMWRAMLTMFTGRRQLVSICAFITSSLLSTVESSQTKAFYELMQQQPLMTYECYRSGETIEPANAVNFAILWDGTQPKNKQVLATTWYETRGQLDSYVTGSFTTVYNNTIRAGVLTSSELQEIVEIVQPPYNEAAYYMKLTITSQNNRVVYKIYDTSATCFNAATLLFKTCYDVRDKCCKCRKSSRQRETPLSKPRRELGCSELKFTRYPQAEPIPLCANYHSCTKGATDDLEPTLTAYAEIILPPFNGAAYYFQITITSQNNRVVYKVYDTSGTCLNAATLVFKTCYDVRNDCCKQRDSCQGPRGIAQQTSP